jgi:hypothetical protein
MSAEALASKGRRLRSLKVGDHVKIFCPPSAKEATKRCRKAKHLMQWRGPYKIVARPSATSLKLEHLYDKSKKFQRYIANVRRWTARLPTRAELEASEPGVPGDLEDIKEDDFLIVKASADSQLGELIQVGDMNDTTTTFKVWGTTCATGGKRLPKATFRPAYVDSADDKTIFSRKRPRGKRITRFTWRVPTEELPRYIVMRPAKVTTKGKFTLPTLRAWERVSRGSPLKIRRYK